MYKLSPSDFAYLYEECKFCYVLKIKQGIIRPSMPMPGVFSALNSRLQGLLVGKDLRQLSSSLPAGIVESQEGHIESQVIPATKVYIKGKYDLLVRQPADKTKFENGRAILDFPPQWLEIPIDEPAFMRFMGEVSLLLEGPTPMENPRCPWCQYRHLGEKLAHPQTSDIPF